MLKDINTIHFLVPESTTWTLYQEHIGRYVFASRFVHGKLVLDVACGVGYGSRHMHLRGASEVVGGDLSKDALRYGELRYKQDGLHFVRIEATNLPFRDSSFDVVVSLEIIEHIKEPDRFLSECSRVLKENGIFVCSTPNKECIPPIASKISPFHVKEFSPKELLDLLSRYFTCITSWGQIYHSRFRHYLDFTKSRLLKASGKVLSKLPRGTMIKTLLKDSLFKDAFIEPRRFKENFNRVLDKRYEVSPFQNNFWRTPFDIIATAKKKL